MDGVGGRRDGPVVAQRDSRPYNLCLSDASISPRHISFISVAVQHRYIAQPLQILTSDNSAAA